MNAYTASINQFIGCQINKQEIGIMFAYFTKHIVPMLLVVVALIFATANLVSPGTATATAKVDLSATEYFPAGYVNQATTIELPVPTF